MTTVLCFLISILKPTNNVNISKFLKGITILSHIKNPLKTQIRTSFYAGLASFYDYFRVNIENYKISKSDAFLMKIRIYYNEYGIQL